MRALHRAYAQARRLAGAGRAGRGPRHRHRGRRPDRGPEPLGAGVPRRRRRAQSCALGSVKSMIGHSKCAAGLAGLIKTAFALHHKVLPPTLGGAAATPAVSAPDSAALPEHRGPAVGPRRRARRAAVSAFGFGGTNFHAVLEEYTGDLDAPRARARARGRGALRVERRGRVRPRRARGAAARSRPVCGRRSGKLAAATGDAAVPAGGRLAIVAPGPRRSSAPRRAGRRAPARHGATDERRFYWRRAPRALRGRSRSCSPARARSTPACSASASPCASPRGPWALETADRVLDGRCPKPPEPPRPPRRRFTDGARTAHAAELRATEVAQPGAGCDGLGLFRLLAALGCARRRPPATATASTPALAAAGAIAEGPRCSAECRHGRGRAIADETPRRGRRLDARGLRSRGRGRTTVAGVEDPGRSNRRLATADRGVRHPRGTRASRGGAGGPRDRESWGQVVAAGFHSPLVAGAADAFADVVRRAELAAPRLPVYANAARGPTPPTRPPSPRCWRRTSVAPVRFAEEVGGDARRRRRHLRGSRTGTTLTGLVDQILEHRPHTALAVEGGRRAGWPGFLDLLARLWTAGAPVDAARLSARLSSAGYTSRTCCARTRRRQQRRGWSTAPAPAGRAPRPMCRRCTEQSTTYVPTVAAAGRGAGPAHRRAECLDEFQRVWTGSWPRSARSMLGFLGGGSEAPTGTRSPGSPVAEPVTQDRGPDRIRARPEPARDHGQIDELREIVARRTGYPPEMLTDALDLEADLGSTRSSAPRCSVSSSARARRRARAAVRGDRRPARHPDAGRARGSAGARPSPTSGEQSPPSVPRLVLVDVRCRRRDPGDPAAGTAGSWSLSTAQATARATARASPPTSSVSSARVVCQPSCSSARRSLLPGWPRPRTRSARGTAGCAGWCTSTTGRSPTRTTPRAPSPPPRPWSSSPVPWSATSATDPTRAGCWCRRRGRRSPAPLSPASRRRWPPSGRTPTCGTST